MSENDRPRPEYGEYATEEELAEARARFGPVVEPDHGSTGPGLPAGSTGPSSLGHGGASRAAPRVTPSPRTGASATPTSSMLADRFVTVLLLSFGLVYLLGGAAGYLNLARTLSTLYSQFDIGTYVATSATTAFGIAFVVAQSLVWIATAWWSYRRLSTGRRSWWVPILGALAYMVVTAAIFTVLLAGDPAFQRYVSGA